MSTATPTNHVPTQTQNPPHHPFLPQGKHIRAVRRTLHSLGLPTELILTILDHARYWVERTRVREADVKLHDWRVADPQYAVPYHWMRVGLRPVMGEMPKIREVRFSIYSHDQGGVTRSAEDMYKTSSWFEVSIVRGCEGGIPVARRGLCFGDVEGARRHAEKYHAELEFVPRPDARIEEQRMHCVDMMKITRPGWPSGGVLPDEGLHAWYVQGNRITFQGGEDEPMDDKPIERRYWVRWGCAENPVWDGDEGSGKGEGFIDSLRDGDCILLWARVKRPGWENHVYRARISIKFTMYDDHVQWGEYDEEDVWKDADGNSWFGPR